MAHDDTIDALAYACKFAQPPAGIKESKDNKISVETFKAEGTKCPLCWKIRVGSCLRNGKKCAFEN